MCVMYVFVINDKREEGRKEEKIYLYVLCIVINKGKIRERGEREKRGEKIWAEVYLYG